MNTIEVDPGGLRKLVWPIGIALWLAVVVAVNIGFVVVAMSDADPIASSYEAGER